MGALWPIKSFGKQVELGHVYRPTMGQGGMIDCLIDRFGIGHLHLGCMVVITGLPHWIAMPGAAANFFQDESIGHPIAQTVHHHRSIVC